MAIVTKTIKGNAYRYEQHSQRVGGKVVTKSKYLGPVTPKRKKDGLTLGAIVAGLLQASAQSFAPKHEKKEHHSRARAPDARSRQAQNEYDLQKWRDRPVTAQEWDVKRSLMSDDEWRSYTAR